MPITITVIVMPAFSQIFSGFAGDPQRTPSHMDRSFLAPKNLAVRTNRDKWGESTRIGHDRLPNGCGACERVPGVHTKELWSELTNCNQGGSCGSTKTTKTSRLPGG